MATKAEVRQKVGEDLGLVSIGQTLESQDQAKIDTTFDEAYARLKEKGLASWAASGNVPTAIVPYFCLLIEEKLLTPYSVPESRYLRIKGAAGENGVIAIHNIAHLSVQEYMPETDEADY